MLTSPVFLDDVPDTKVVVMGRVYVLGMWKGNT